MAAQTATILVTDLVGSTALREQLGEDEAESVRREYDRALVDAATASGGTVVKHLGDGILVIFAGAAEAVAAAVAMQRAIDLLSRNRGLTLETRIGVSAGDVTLEAGDSFGVPVVEASRLCAIAAGRHIVVADVVRVLARGRGGHEMSPLGDLQLKGLSEPVTAWDVAWAPAPGAADLRARTPYVGRARERALLTNRIAAARNGTGGLVLVTGEPGIGKSRLVAEACSEHDDLVVLNGGCHDGEVVPYAPFTEAITDWVRRTSEPTVRDVLGEDAAVVARIAPGVRDVITDAGDPVPVTTDAETARLYDAVGQVLTRLTAIAPVALIVEDLHWADDATVGMLRAVARLAVRIRLVVFGTYRETDLDRRHPFATALPLLQREAEPTRIALDGLDTADVQTLLERISGHEVPDQFATSLATETDGNPFFLRETLLHLADEGWLRFEDGRWVGDPNRPLSIPAGVRDVVGRRLSRLSPAANKLLAAGALFEVSFPIGVAAAVADLDENVALDAIDEALEARIVAPTDAFDRYEFTHALFRHTLVDELNPSRQVRMHRAIAEAIEKELRGAPDAATAATLVRHYARSAALPGAERGVPFALAVADDAAARYARHEELSALRTALEMLDPDDEQATPIRCRAAIAAARAHADDDELFADTEAAAERVAEEAGIDAACDFVVEVFIATTPLEDITLSWRIAGLARRWLRPERRDRSWSYLRFAELFERDFNDPLAPGIPTDDEAYRELRSVLRTLPAEDNRYFGLINGPASRDEVLAVLERNPAAFSAALASGSPRICVAATDAYIESSRQERVVGSEATGLALRSRYLTILGEFDEAAESLAAAFALIPRVPPGSNAVFQVLASVPLNNLVLGDLVGPEAVDALLAFAERPDTQWAGLATRLAAARALAMTGDDRALEILEASLPGIDRAAPWAPNAPLVFAFAVYVIWALERTDHLGLLERIVRKKWLEPDVRYAGTDSRWHLALLCALDGRVDDAREWFAQARRVLRDAESEPAIVGVDHDAALMELRLGAAGDRARFAECVAAARARCTHPAMAPWLARLDELERRAAETW